MLPGNRRQPSKCAQKTKACARTGSLQFPLGFSLLSDVTCLKSLVKLTGTDTDHDGDETVHTVADNAIHDQDGDQHTLLTAINEIDPPDLHPGGERDPNQRPDADQESFRPPALETDEGEPDTGIYTCPPNHHEQHTSSEECDP